MTLMRELDDAEETILLQRAEIDRIEAENDFLKSFLQSHTLQMSGERSYKWRGGWPLWEIKGNGVDDAVRNGMAAVKREKSKMKEKMDE